MKPIVRFITLQEYVQMRHHLAPRRQRLSPHTLRIAPLRWWQRALQWLMHVGDPVVRKRV